MKLAQIASIIAGSIKNRKDTFPIKDGYVDCELGGTFRPSCEEMILFTENKATSPNQDDPDDDHIYDVVNLKAKRPVIYSNAATRLFYEVLKKDTNFDFIEARIRAAGAIECSVIAAAGNENKIVQQQLLNFGPEAKTLSLPFIDLISLPRNGSLFLKLQSLGGNGYVYGFRWIGKVPCSVANTGERLLLINTLEHKAEIIDRLEAIAEAYGEAKAATLKRTLFIIYDGNASQKHNAWEGKINNLRMLVLSGPAYGVSRNASLLASLVLEVSGPSNDNISEITILSDEAIVDAETLLRHDSFITGRKPNIISSSTLFSASSPSMLQIHNLSGSKNQSQGSTIAEHYKSCEDIPYLTIYSENITIDDISKYIAQYTTLNFTPFVFISFPYALLKEDGAPLPLFFHNNDIEICLRCMARGGKIIVNPNLQVWNEASYPAGMEFYNLMHGMIVNSVYDDIDIKDFYIKIMDKLVKMAKKGHYTLLRIHELALKKFAQGPEWMAPESFFSEYQDTYAALKQLVSDLNSVVPDRKYHETESIDTISKPVDLLQIYSCKDLASLSDGEVSGYGINAQKASARIMTALVSCINQLQKIAPIFDDLRAAWKDFIGNFNHQSFWDKLLDEASITVAYLQLGYNIPASVSQNSPLMIFKTDAETEDREVLYEKLPQGFTIQGYLESNPDVKAAGVDPVEHWFTYGQFENRNF